MFSNHISLANITAEGNEFSDELNEGNQQYTLIINTTKLSVGVTYLSIVAEKTNYEAQTLTFRVEVLNRETELYLDINGKDKTAQKSYKIEWDENINIKIEYIDKDLNQFIKGAISI